MRMEVIVKNMTGKTWTIKVQSTDTIETLMIYIGLKNCIPTERQMLFFNGKELFTGTLAEHNIQNGSVIDFMILM
ncbi:hypothetical protein ACP275_13G092700 [Erythranthe tilingii]